MATIVIYPQADLAAVEAVLDGLARRVDGQWLVEAGPLFVMVFAGSRLTPGDGFDPAELTRLATGLGRPVTCAVCVEIPAGAGDAAREFTVGVLSACGGRAEDEASGHLWSLSEITERLQVGHLRFYDRGRYGEYRVPFAVPAEHVRYAAVADADDIVRGHRDGWLSAADATRLAFLRRCDMTDRRPEFGLLERVTPGTGEYEQVAATIVDRWGSSSPFWEYAAASWCYTLPAGERDRKLRELADATGSPDLVDVAADPDGYGPAWLACWREQFLLGPVADGDGMNWADLSALMGTDRPEEVDAAFERAEPNVGVAVIGLALTHPDPQPILARTARALASDNPALRAQAIVALAHAARLHGVVDRANLRLLRRSPRGNAADDDLWTFVPHRRLPWWLWRHQLVRRCRWHLWERWLP
ncbi:hypothetical protein [Catellatospora bangladeshensis]|uniref:Uncharacterized protein n=2 Tax=Catellatospora bangladeshensis TaxID=310355 RepID=A0A8J3JRS4_9ACTN|nr:hypothetical protein [Catellatospora bangladeshensis]GIF82609.1 hypothetical protein Cba03nite_39580 [Catellatospora bangladeshensis]